MTILEGLTSSHPNHAQAQYQLGKALLEQGKSAEAVKHLELAEQNDPGPDYIHYQLQAAYRKEGRTEDADTFVYRVCDASTPTANCAFTESLRRRTEKSLNPEKARSDHAVDHPPRREEIS